MTTSPPASSPESNTTPSGATRAAMDDLNVEFALPTDASPMQDLPCGAVLCNRYRINHSLGKGGFGGVYLAVDLDLGRKVAIKRQLGRHLQDNELARNEAKFIAGLDHAGIVKVYDLIDDPHEGVLIIMEHVDGKTLHDLLRQQRLSESRALELAAEVAQALVHAHSRRIVHRDLKPSNVLLDRAEKVKITDFGLALGAINFDTAPSAAGTPKYMAPEQIRGEAHRIDGRTDIWSLGVMLYEMLTGSLPFTGPSRGATFESILHDEPTPPRQLNPRVSESVENIILRCLRKRMSERPVSASDLLDDLKACQASVASLDAETGLVGAAAHPAATAPDSRTPRSVPSLSPSGTLRVEPKGLRAYSEEDGVHFLELIPGPRERSGLPESIHFWKKWASCDNVDEYASVGVLYGPSGAGKTSFIRAGLINQLDNDICPIVIECRSGDLARRIESAIRNRFHQKQQTGSLSKLLSRLRSEEGGIHGYRKILLVLDQFESWSTTATPDDRRALAEALRHCDGKTLQSLFVVRDDYWSGITEIMQWIDVPLVEHRNVRSLELLDKRHAQRVLEGIGRAHAILPRAPEPLSATQQNFIQQAVEGLSNNDRIVAVHLVMFAQIVRALGSWTPQTLRNKGGVEGACSAYLHEIFETTSGPPAYRRIASVVVDILNELLPSQGDPLRASAKSMEELRARVLGGAAGAKVSEAVRVLSEDLKLITPTRGDSANESLSSEGAEGYQLAHDFLVTPVRNWVELARKSTWRGRAVARLIELSELWQRKPQSQFLPSLSEYAAMEFVVPSGSRTDRQSKFLRAAGRYHAGKAAGMAIATLAAVFFAVLALDQYSKRASADQGKRYAEVSQYVHGSVSEVHQLLNQLSGDSRNLSMVNALLENTTRPEAIIRGHLLSQRLKKQSFATIANQLEHAEPALFDIVLEAAKSESANAALNLVAGDTEGPPERRARAAILLLHLGDSTAVQSMSAESDNAESMRSALIDTAMAWKGPSEAWVEWLVKTADPQCQWLAAVVLGLYPDAKSVSASDWSRIQQLRNSQSAVAHSTIDWLLQRHGKADDAPAEPPPNANWIVTETLKIEMARLEPGAKDYIAFPGHQSLPDKASLDKSAIVSLTPVTRNMYERFLATSPMLPSGVAVPKLRENGRIADDLEQHPQRPAVGMSYNDAIAFINWASEQEKRTPVYKFAGMTEPTAVAEPRIRWERDASANGFRLPTDNELRYVLTGKVTRGAPWLLATRINRAIGRTDLIDQMANTKLVRTTIPNSNGIFCLDQASFFWLDSPGSSQAYSAMIQVDENVGYFLNMSPPLDGATLDTTILLIAN